MWASWFVQIGQGPKTFSEACTACASDCFSIADRIPSEVICIFLYFPCCFPDFPLLQEPGGILPHANSGFSRGPNLSLVDGASRSLERVWIETGFPCFCRKRLCDLPMVVHTLMFSNAWTLWRVLPRYSLSCWSCGAWVLLPRFVVSDSTICI